MALIVRFAAPACTFARRLPLFATVLLAVPAVACGPVTAPPARASGPALARSAPAALTAAPVASAAPAAPSADPAGALPTGTTDYWEDRCARPGVALVLAVDRSGSMKGQPLQQVRVAVTSAAADLHDSDELEVIAFDTTAARVAKLWRVSKMRAGLTASLAGLQASGGTSFFPALDMAYQDLAVVSSCRKHLVLITDGTSPSDGIRELVTAMASEAITVSTVALGGTADRVILQTMADLGGGRFYSLPTPEHLSEVVAKEVALLEKEVAAAGW